MDGAHEWQRFWHMTLPLLGHTLVLAMVLLAIGALQEFTLPNVLTGGGPGNSTCLDPEQLHPGRHDRYHPVCDTSPRTMSGLAWPHLPQDCRPIGGGASG